MQRFTRRSLVFLSGLLLAVGVQRVRGVPSSGNISSEARSSSQNQIHQYERASAPQPMAEQVPAPQLESAESSLSNSRGERARVVPPASPSVNSSSREDLLRAIQAAAREGSSRSLERLNGKALANLPEYHQEVLPILKKETLQVLLRRFSESDWTDWPRSSFVLEGSPTPARTYVNDVFIVNEDVGRFLETAALLLYVSYSSAAEGKIIQPEKALERVFSQSDRLMAYRSAKSIAPREMLDPEILSLPFVKERLKQIQSSLVMRYIRAHPNDYSLLFDLLAQLPNETVSSEVNDALADLLQRFSLEASAQFRREILDKILSGHSIAERSRSDARVSRSLAHLFLMGVVDALEVGDMRRADLYLDESYSFDPHLPAQDMVAEAIREANSKALLKAKDEKSTSKEVSSEGGGLLAEVEKSKPLRDESSFDLLSDSTGSGKTKKSSSGTFLERLVTTLFLALVALLTIGGTVLYVLYRRGLKSAGPLEDDGPPSGSRERITATSASEVSFGATSSDKKAESDEAPRTPQAARAQLRAASLGG